LAQSGIISLAVMLVGVSLGAIGVFAKAKRSKKKEETASDGVSHAACKDSLGFMCHFPG
jgi:hypothetical protein